MRDTQSTVALSDTSAAAREVYFQRLAEMTPGERVRLAAALWETAHSLQCAAMRRRNPDADEAEIAFQIAVTRFGAELARTVYRRA
jgi:Rv0078B-related antitoxin